MKLYLLKRKLYKLRPENLSMMGYERIVANHTQWVGHHIMAFWRLKDAKAVTAMSPDIWEIITVMVQ